MTLILKDVKLSLDRFALDIQATWQGPVTALLGPSGAGKTTLLEIIAGLRHAPSAFVQWNDRILTDTREGRAIPARHRRIGYLPQEPALFPHRDVQQNIVYGQPRASRGSPHFSWSHVVKVLEIEPLLQRRIQGLSGGEQRRVALARALVSSPDLLLLDEPLSGLDPPLKTRILGYLKRIRDEWDVPMVYVTHDRHEAMALAPEVAVMMEGRILQSGSVESVFHRPTHVDVAGWLDVETILPGKILAANEGLVQVKVGPAVLQAARSPALAEGAGVHVCIRAENIILSKGEPQISSARNLLPVTLISLENAGAMHRVELDAGFPLTVLLTHQARESMNLKPGDRLIAMIKAPHVHLIPR